MRFDELFMHEQKVRRTSFVVKILVFFISALCIISFSLSGSAETHDSRLALAWVTYGSQLIISGYTFCGMILNETTPTLTACQNLISGCLFLASGVCCVVSYAEGIPESTGWSDEAGLDALLATGVLAIITSLLQALDTFFAITLRNIQKPEHLMPPFWSI